jgi:NNP family nitrate/nitrite transporter-like MFS transporter
MQLKGFLKAGHTPTLLCAFLYFDISFMVWVILGPLANAIVPSVGLSGTERWWMVALPLLGGSVLRLVLGPLTDHIGPRRTGMLGLVLTLIPLLLGWLWADSFSQLVLIGLMLGVAGASFAVALPMAGRWYPPQYQGLAMGIAGAGNSGTALATLFSPMLAQWLGWRPVFALALIPITLTLLVFALFAKDSPNQPAPKPLRAYASVLAHKDTWWFCLFYSVTFGGFVGFASFLNSFFKLQYGVTDVQAGYFTTLCVLSGSMLRPIGGYLADRFGGIRMLLILYAGSGLSLLGMYLLPPAAAATALMFLCMGLLGMGNGSVFQLVPQRFPKEIGVLTGVVGAAGGLGGFFLPLVLGNMREATGTFAYGFLVYAGLSMFCVAALWYVAQAWQGAFVGHGGRARVAEPAAVPEEVVTPAPADSGAEIPAMPAPQEAAT